MIEREIMMIALAAIMAIGTASALANANKLNCVEIRNEVPFFSPAECYR